MVSNQANDEHLKLLGGIADGNLVPKKYDAQLLATSTSRVLVDTDGKIAFLQGEELSQNMMKTKKR